MCSSTGIEQLPGFLRITVGEEFHGALQIGEQHRHLFALAFESTARGENFLREIGRGVGERYAVLGAGWHGDREGHGASAPDPDQDSARLIGREVLGLNEFLFEGVEGVVLQLELDLECTIRHTLTLTEDGNHLIEDGVKVHRAPFMCSEAFRNTGQGVWVPFVAHVYRKAPAKESRKCGSAWRRGDLLAPT